MSSSDAEAQGRAIRWVTDLRSRDFDEELIQLLSSEDDEVREAAAEALGLVGSSAALEPLIRTTEDPEKDVRKEAIRALGRLKDPKAIPTLADLLWDDKSAKEAIKSIARIEHPAAIEPLEKFVAEGPERRRSLAEATLFRLYLRLGVRRRSNGELVEVFRMDEFYGGRRLERAGENPAD